MQRSGPALALVFVVAAPGIRAQAEWNAINYHPRFAHVIAYDPTVGHLRAIHGSGLFAWTGSRWELRGSPPTITGTSVFAAGPTVFDGARRTFLRFGGFYSDSVGGRYVSGATWDWTGTGWRELYPPTRPGARGVALLAFDSRRGVVVLFGGSDLFAGLSYTDTWHWDGAAWRAMSPATRPPDSDGWLGFDEARAVCVFVSRRSRTDVWEWDATSWRQITVTSPPAGPWIYDAVRQRLVMVSSGASEVNLSTWDGARWTFLSSLAGTRNDASAYYDQARGQVVVMGGVDTTAGRHDVHEWDGSRWIEQQANSDIKLEYVPTACWDPVRRRVVSWVGTEISASPPRAELFEWGGRRWSRVAFAVGPGPRQGPSLAPDPRRQRVVMFGGTAFWTTVLDETWEWDGATWQQHTPNTVPAARSRAAMAYDERRGRVVMFGGRPSHDDTWEWDGVDWTQRNPTTSPPSSAFLAMAHHAPSGRSILLNDDGELWQWDGGDWSRIGPTLPSDLPHVVYDRARERIVARTSEAWEWDGATWTRDPTPMSAIPDLSAMVYDEQRERVVGLEFQSRVGYAHTWEYATDQPALFETFSAGCAGSSGPVRLDASARPWTGSTIVLRVSPARFVAGVLVGTSRTRWGGFDLPLDLTRWGLPGCFLDVSVDVVVPMQPNGGTSSASVAIPSDPSVVGLELFLQGLAVDPSANPAGLTTTNARRARVGVR